MCRSDFLLAIEEYNKALKLRIQFDEKFSRCTAEIYFYLYKVYESDPIKAFGCIVKARLIMEYHIRNKLKDLGKNELFDKIEIDEKILDKNLEDFNYKEINLKNKIYYEQKEFQEGNLLSLPNNILDLVDIVKDIDLKVFKLFYLFLFVFILFIHLIL